MPSRLFHVVLFTDDIDETARFLVEVVGLTDPRWFDNDAEQSTRVFGWPHVEEPGRRVVLGQAPGMVELVEIPVALRGTVEPGVAFLAFATPDVEGYADRSSAAGFPAGPVQTVDGVGEPSTLAAVRVGGLPFEFMRFGS